MGYAPAQSLALPASRRCTENTVRAAALPPSNGSRAIDQGPVEVVAGPARTGMHTGLSAIQGPPLRSETEPTPVIAGALGMIDSISLPQQRRYRSPWRNVESRTGAPASGSGGGSVAFAPGLSPAPMAAFPVPAHQTGRADFPHPAFGRDHAIACRRPLVLGDRRVRPYSSRSLVSGKRTYFPDFTLCLRQSHRRSRRIAWRSTAL